MNLELWKQVLNVSPQFINTKGQVTHTRLYGLQFFLPGTLKLMDSSGHCSAKTNGGQPLSPLVSTMELGMFRRTPSAYHFCE